MRCHLAIIFSLICGQALADPAVVPVQETPVAVGPRSFLRGELSCCGDRNACRGITLLGFTISADGTVKDAKVLKSSGNNELDNASLKCASSWLYKPATEDGVPVQTPWQANVSWRIPDSPEVRRGRYVLEISQRHTSNSTECRCDERHIPRDA
ncbi:MAG: energy transducer TonB [Rhizomicrobium sp.]